MFHATVARGQPFAGFFRLVIEWTHAAAVRDMATLVDDVNAFRPRGVRVVRGVAHVVDAEGQGKFESLDEIIRDNYPLFQRFRLRIANVVLQIGFHLPFIRGMRFANVHGQKIGALLVVVVNLDDVANLAAERRSSKTPKNQHERALVSSFTDVETANAVQRDNPSVRRITADLQRAAMHVRKGVPHHAVSVLRASRHV